MIDPRLDDALAAAAEKARLFTADTLAGAYVDGWRQAIAVLGSQWELAGPSKMREARATAIHNFCNEMLPAVVSDSEVKE